jgi:chromosome segregation ATPase
MNQTVETELQRVLAAYRAQERVVENQAAVMAELRGQMRQIDAEIDTAKAELAMPGSSELDLALIRSLAAERRQTELRLEQLGRDRAGIAARIRDVERSRRAMELELRDGQQRCWKALFDELKSAVDTSALQALLVAGLEAGFAEAAVRAAILPNPTDRDRVADQLRERFALPK